MPCLKKIAKVLVRVAFKNSARLISEDIKSPRLEIIPASPAYNVLLFHMINISFLLFLQIS